MKCLALLVLASILPTGSLAYETETHALMSNRSYSTSVLAASGPTSVVHNLGLDRLDPTTPFGVYWGAPLNAGPNEYVDNFTGQFYPPDEFERCNMREFLIAGFPPSDPRILLFKNTVDLPGENTKLPIRNWVVRGAVREDDLGVATGLFSANCNPLSIAPSTGSTVRVLNHFFDPINDTGLSACPPLLGPCQKSVDWALGFVDSFASPPFIDTGRRNHFSYEDARQAMWLALTEEFSASDTSPPSSGDRRNAAANRLYQWATVFRDMGDVVHLIQDTAQPQHTRNDPHSSFDSPEQQAFEGFTNARVLGQTVGAGGSYVRSFFGENLSAKIPPPPMGNYPAVTFATPQRFFTKREVGDTPSTSPDNRYGLADYTNRGFFTGGTLPGSSTDPYAEPPQTLDGPHGYTAVTRNCFLPTPNVFPPAQAVTCAHYTRAVSDTVDQAYSSQDVLPSGFTQPPLVTQSVFSQPILAFAPGTNYISENAVGIEELVTMANLSIPRAIGYSAGMINYFFRGKIAITPPPAGIYAIFDHSVAHTVDADGYPRDAQNNIFGFTQVQMNVRNDTAPIVESGSGITVNQRMKNGQLVAVARYHRNQCYKPDLSGEIAENYTTGEMHLPVGCDVIASRSTYQEISVSTPIAVDAAGAILGGFDLNGTTPILTQFDFSADPIPVNATDLFLQVVYRGNMGDTIAGTLMIEPDAIAVGMVDVSEPTFGAVFNEDYFQYHDQWLTADQARPLVPAGVDVDPSALVNVQYCIDDHLVGSKGLANHPVAGLQPARQVRYAAILDISQAHTHTDVAQFWENGQPDTQVLIVNAPVFQRDAQADMEQDPLSGPGAYAPDAQTWGRGVVWGSWNTTFYKAYQPYDLTPHPANAPLPAGFVPDTSDATYLNNPNPALCNQQGNRVARLPEAGRNGNASNH